MILLYQKLERRFTNEVKKIQPAKILAAASMKMGKISANSACCYIYHQPKMPDALKKMKNR